MQEATGSAAAASARFGPTGRLLLSLSRMLAIAGGLVFVGLVVMSIVSIVGRKLFSWVVPGDVELLQMCAAFAASGFFAYCHMMNGDVKVDFFTQNMAPRRVARMDALGSLLVGLFGLLIGWRTTAGALSLLEVGETSAILGLPVWIAQALMVPGFLLLAAVGFYMCVFHLRMAASHAVGAIE
jgi:TRAP-type mannitol/chloroaromatic compound transport system permease small subunit